MERQVSDALVLSIAHPHRRALIDALIDAGELTVGELVDRVPLAFPAVSQHLKVLASVGLVMARAEGRKRIYRADLRPLEEIVDWMLTATATWRTHSHHLAAFLDQQERLEKDPR